MIAPCAEPPVASAEFGDSALLLLPDTLGCLNFNPDAVHQTVTPEGERGADRAVDIAALVACLPGPPGAAAGRGPEADDAEIMVTGYISADPLCRGVLVVARLPQH